jgi:asparagine synthase (glutamine-hydrolysing)
MIGNGAEAPQLDTVSHVYSESPESDERAFIQLVEEKRHTVGHHFSEYDYPLMIPVPDMFLSGKPGLAHCFALRERAICKAMDDAGARVQLCGEGGDELLGNTTGAALAVLVDLLWSGEFREGYRDLRRWSLALNKPCIKLAWEAVLALLPLQIESLLKAEAPIAQLADRNFASRYNLRLRKLGVPDPYDFVRPSQRCLASGLAGILLHISQDPYRSMGCVEIRYPYLHRPLVDFLLSIPSDQLVRPGERRSLMRRALRGIVPDKILRRRSKQGPTPALHRAINREWHWIEPLLADARVCSRGYVNSFSLLATARRIRHGLDSATDLAAIVSLELWLRQAEARGVIVDRSRGRLANPPGVDVQKWSDACKQTLVVE